MNSLQRVDTFIYNIAKKIAGDTFQKYMKNPFLKYYLILKPTSGYHKELSTIEYDEKLPENCELAWSEHIPRNATNQQLIYWIKEKMNHMPLIPENFDSLIIK